MSSTDTDPNVPQQQPAPRRGTAADRKAAEDRDRKPEDEKKRREETFNEANEKIQAVPEPGQDEVDAIKEGHGNRSKEEREARAKETEKRDKERRERDLKRREYGPRPGSGSYETR